MYVSHTTRNVSQCTSILYKKVTLHTEYILGLLFCLLNIGCIRYHDATHSQDSPFGSLWYSIMTIIVYTVGGPENIMLDLDNDWSEDHFLFPVASYLLWIIFIVAMSVLFLNLLVWHWPGSVPTQ